MSNPTLAVGRPRVWRRKPPRFAGGRRAVTRFAMRLACIAVILLMWQLVVGTELVPPDAVAPPNEIAGALGSLIASPELLSSVGATVASWVTGLAASLALALPLGLILGASDRTYRMFRVTIDFLRTIPPIALLPLLLLLYGATDQMVLVLVVFGSVWPALLQTMYGVHQVDPASRDVARAYRLRRRDVILLVIVPSAAPFIATGIRIAATISLLLTVAAEFLGGVPGIGASIALAQQTQQIASMYAYVVVGAALGVVMNLLMFQLERRALSWHSSTRLLEAS